MAKIMTLNNVMEAAEVLSLEEQETLLDVLHNRYIEHRRENLASDIEKANLEYKTGQCKSANPSDIMKETS